MIIGIGYKDIFEGLMASGLVYTEMQVSWIFRALVCIYSRVVRNISLNESIDLVLDSIWVAIFAHVS